MNRSPTQRLVTSLFATSLAALVVCTLLAGVDSVLEKPWLGPHAGYVLSRLWAGLAVAVLVLGIGWRIQQRRLGRQTPPVPRTPRQRLNRDLLALLIFGILLEYLSAMGGQGCSSDDCVKKSLLAPVAIIGGLAAIRAAFYFAGKK
jgi:hypothetical protein